MIRLFKRKALKSVEINENNKTITLNIINPTSLFDIGKEMEKAFTELKIETPHYFSLLKDGVKLELKDGWRFSTKTIRNLVRKDKRRYKRRTSPAEKNIIQIFMTRGKE